MLLMNRIKEKSLLVEDENSKVSSIAPKKRKMRWYWAAAAAAAVIVIVSALGFGRMFLNQNAKKSTIREVNEISTRLGSKSRVELPDGSIVWLNAGSKLTYDKNFGQDLREVTLSGEGFLM